MLLLAIMHLCLISTGEELVAGPPEKVAGDFKFVEGPVWLPAGELIFSDISGNTIYRADKTVFRHPSNYSNGLTLDREGRLITCETGMRRVTRTEKDGTITVVADRFLGKKFNAPNDAVVRSDGTIFLAILPMGLTRVTRNFRLRACTRWRPKAR